MQMRGSLFYSNLLIETSKTFTCSAGKQGRGWGSNLIGNRLRKGIWPPYICVKPTAGAKSFQACERTMQVSNCEKFAEFPMDISACQLSVQQERKEEIPC